MLSQLAAVASLVQVCYLALQHACKLGQGVNAGCLRSAAFNLVQRRLGNPRLLRQGVLRKPYNLAPLADCLRGESPPGVRNFEYIISQFRTFVNRCFDIFVI